jgi:hypothetical protein
MTPEWKNKTIEKMNKEECVRKKGIMVIAYFK